MRIDSYLFEQGLAKSRTFAKVLLEKGFVKVNGMLCRKPSFDVSETDTVEVTGKPYDYVSRGGLKLEAALNAFGIDVSGKRCVDVGASTGGFTDCLLKHGAPKVYAVDSGTAQLDLSLVNDDRVVSIENFNAKNLSDDVTDGYCDVAVCDVSFISQTLILSQISSVLSDNGIYVGLVKPQFECGRDGLKKGGIVKSDRFRVDAIEKVISFAEKCSLGTVGLIRSPILGGDGNTEYLIYCIKNINRKITNEEIRKVVTIEKTE